MGDRDADPLRERLLEWLDTADAAIEGPQRAGTEDPFNELALRVFERNYTSVAAYGAYCHARGRTPAEVTHWLEIPAVPTAAFKEVELRAPDRPAESVFRTSGTTRGRERRGAHYVADLGLYRASLRPTFRSFLLPDDARLRFLSLMPPAPALPDSSLAFMITDATAAFGAEGSEAFATVEGKVPSGTNGAAGRTEGPSGVAGEAVIDFDRLEAEMDATCAAGEPVLLVGTSSAFIHWLDRLETGGRRYRLPEGSRLMDTGGSKGRGRRIDPAALRDLYGTRLGLEPWTCVNEYGMTELLSQRYDDGLRSHHQGVRRPTRKHGPAWLRSVAVDPETLEPLPAGQLGALRHVDLANLDSVAAVQTEDFGRVFEDGGVVVEGRAAGAPPRGCSIAMDLLLGGDR